MVREKLPAWLMPLALAAALVAALACGSAEEAVPSGETADTATNETDNETATQSQEKPKLPEGPPIEGFAQLMPRGGIPALFDPQFVTADAAEIPDEAWIMGFEHEGNAYAYDLNILNHHEVVNHTVGELPIAAVW